MRRISRWAAAAAVCLHLTGRSAAAADIGGIGDAQLVAADDDLGNRLTHGRTYAEQLFSPLAYIHDGNIGDLELLWTFPTGLTRGHEATPIAVDGVLYFTGTWSVVFAVDARTGKELWRYDPQVSKETGKKGCCDVVNRSVAVYRGRVYTAAFDGGLLALDARTGKREWEVVTVDQTQPYTITGAPRVVKRKVVIGNGGGEMGVRGYVSAYDPTDGKLVFQGTADARFVAYSADTGRPLWEDHTGSGVIAPPITYLVDGKQYVTVLAGWGGAFALAGGSPKRTPS